LLLCSKNVVFQRPEMRAQATAGGDEVPPPAVAGAPGATPRRVRDSCAPKLAYARQIRIVRQTSTYDVRSFPEAALIF
jgi:hypothetical protein